MRPEYDITGGVRGKYASRLKGHVVMVTLAPDVATAFPDADSVNGGTAHAAEDSLSSMTVTAKKGVNENAASGILRNNY